jgi:hypothetical protein
VKREIEVKVRCCVFISAVLLGWLPAGGVFTAEEATKPKKQIVKPLRNGVRVYIPPRVWIGIVDKDADVEILPGETDEWCKVQYTKDGSRFVGWIRKRDLDLPKTPAPKKEEETGPKILSVEETSEQFRKLVRIGVDYKSSRGGGFSPGRPFGHRWAKVGRVEMKLRLDGKGRPAKTLVLRHFQRDAAIQFYVENKIVQLKEFKNTASPVFYRVIDWYIRAFEAYNEDKIPDFRRLIESADNFWDAVDDQSK